MPEDEKRHWTDYAGAAGVAVAFVALLWNGCNTRQQLALTRRTLELSHRPWLTGASITVDTTGQSVRVSWKNVGSGPARKLTAIYVPGPSGAGYPVILDNSMTALAISTLTNGDRILDVRTVLGVGESLDSTMQLPSDLQERVKEGKGIAVFAKVEFYDVFGKPHWSRLCRQYVNGTMRVCELAQDAADDV